MTAEQAALLATVREKPDDDTPRLVYADWLEENGLALWAASIRAACQLADPDRHGLTLGQLIDIEADFHRMMMNRELFATMPGIAGMEAWAYGWDGDLFAPTVTVYEAEQPDPVLKVKFRRGFAVGVSGFVADVRRHLPELLKHHTIERAVPWNLVEAEYYDAEVPAELERFIMEWLATNDPTDELIDDPVAHYSFFLIAEARERMGKENPAT